MRKIIIMNKQQIKTWLGIALIVVGWLLAALQFLNVNIDLIPF